MDFKNSKLGIPDIYGNYNYPVFNGKVIVDPSVSNLPIEPLTLKPQPSYLQNNNNNYVIHFIIIAIVILGLIGGIYYLYNKINVLSNYIDNDYKNTVTDIASTVSNQNFNNNFDNKFNLKIKDKTTQISSELIDNIKTKVIPPIINNNASNYLPSTTNAIKIANFYKNNHTLLSNNTLICKNINDINTCTCLYDTCDLFKSIPNYLIIDRQISFTDADSTGLSFSGNLIPVAVDSANNRINNRFSISFYINIAKTVPEDRVIFNWGGDGSHLLQYPALVIRGNTEPDYNGLYRNSLEIRFSHLGKDGMFNVTSDVRGNCLENIPLYVWNHIIITADGKQINMYLNGKLIKKIMTVIDVRIGDPDQWIYVGKPINEPVLKNPYGILLAKMRVFPNVIPDDTIINYASEFIKN